MSQFYSTTNTKIIQYILTKNKQRLALWQAVMFYLIGEPVSRVLSFKTIIYLRRTSLYSSSHLLERCRAGLAFHSGVAPGRVYIKSPSPGHG